MSVPFDVIVSRYAAAAKRLADCRVDYARSWQFNRAKSTSDMMATQMTIEQTSDAITIVQAEMRILESAMEVYNVEPARSDD